MERWFLSYGGRYRRIVLHRRQPFSLCAQVHGVANHPDGMTAGARSAEEWGDLAEKGIVLEETGFT